VLAAVRGASRTRIGLGMELASITVFQLANAVASQLTVHINPLGVTTLRNLFGALLLGLIARPRILRLSRSELMLVLVFGATVGLQSIAFYQAIARLPMGIVVTIGVLGPLGVAVATSSGPRRGLWPALAAVGVALLASQYGTGQSVGVIGLLYAAACGVLWAVYILVAARAGVTFPGVEGLAMALVVAAIICLPAGLVTSGSALVRPSVLLDGFIVAVLTCAVAYSLETLALKRLPKDVFGVFASLEPAAAVIVGLLALGQGLTLREFGGVVIVTGACSGAALKLRPRRGPATRELL
jgi:inner membrane transporter RhtA